MPENIQFFEVWFEREFLEINKKMSVRGRGGGRGGRTSLSGSTNFDDDDREDQGAPLEDATIATKKPPPTYPVFFKIYFLKISHILISQFGQKMSTLSNR